MDIYRTEWYVLVLNGILIALVCTAPLLIAFIAIRILRSGVSEDRRKFEQQVSARLDKMAASLEEIKKQVEALSKRNDSLS